MISRLTKQLEGLYPGYRGCFWLCMEVDDGQIPLIFTRSQNDVSVEIKRLEKRASKMKTDEKNQ